MKATHLGRVIEYFNPTLSLDENHQDWYVERPESPHLEIILSLVNDPTDAKILFSGHLGSGKTSTINRLALDPEMQGKFFIVKISLKDELDIFDVNYTDVLVAIGNQLYQKGEQKMWLDNKLKRELDQWSAEVSNVWSITDKAQAQVEAGIGAWFLRARGLLKTGFEQKKEFRQRFEPRVPQLIEFINRIIHAIETNRDAGGREVLLILEDLDKPSLPTAIELFLDRGSVIVQPQCKIIFTVPISLLYSVKFNAAGQNFTNTFILPNFKLFERNGAPNPEGWSRMEEIVTSRMDACLIQADALKLAVGASGGVTRELIRIVHGAAVRSMAMKANSIAPNHVEDSINKRRAEYSYGLTNKDCADILLEVHRTQKLRSDKNELLLDLLHGLYILQYPDGPGWYGVNPIVHRLIGV